MRRRRTHLPVVVATTVLAVSVHAASGCRPVHRPDAPSPLRRAPDLAAVVSRTESAATARVVTTIDRPGAPRLVVEGVISFVERRAAMTASSPDAPRLSAEVRVGPDQLLLRPAGGDAWVPVALQDSALAGDGWSTPLTQVATARVGRRLASVRVRGDDATRYAVTLGDGDPATVTIDARGRLRRIETATAGGVRTSTELFDFGATLPHDP